MEFGGAAETIGGAPCLCGPDEKHRRPLLLKAAGTRNAARVSDMLACVGVLTVERVGSSTFSRCLATLR